MLFLFYIEIFDQYDENNSFFKCLSKLYND